MAKRKPRLAVFKLASCGGCQLTLLNAEDDLLALSEAVTIASFPEAADAVSRGPFDIALVEGSVTTVEDASRVHAIRRASRTLVAIGACATAGGIQALRNFEDVRAWIPAIYPRPEFVSTLDRSSPVAAHVVVDHELRGCPISKPELLDTIAALVHGVPPPRADHAVCVECKRRASPCLTVTRGAPCLGPVTQAGCGALCPASGRGCFGCHGPKEGANVTALAARLTELGAPGPELVRLLRTFNAGADPFRRESERLEKGRS